MLLVPRAEFSIEEPWGVPRGCMPLALRRADDGEAPRLATTLTLFHDGNCLTALFLGDDDGVEATYLRHDEPLWQEDVVELFLAPERLTRYFEIEVNPLGTTFDAVIDSPDLSRATMQSDLAWRCKDLFAAVRTTPSSLDVVVRLPFASIGAAPEGEWRANFFRIDRASGRHAERSEASRRRRSFRFAPLSVRMTGADEFSAWQPTMKTPPDFHVPGAFGRLRFNA
jgi:hypothetical protein